MNTGPQLIHPAQPEQRNWLPLGIAAGVVLLIAAVAIFLLQHGKHGPVVTAVNAPLDSYAASLKVSDLQMSESGNLAGGKVTYIDGVLTNSGTRTVVGAQVQILFRNVSHEVVQNDTQALKLIRTREPYVDLEEASAAPITPGTSKAFRVSFDAVSPDWDGAYPEIRLVQIDTK